MTLGGCWIEIEDPRVALEGFFGAVEEDEELGPVEPDARLLRPGSEQAVVAFQRGVVFAFFDERLGFLPKSARTSFVFELARRKLESNCVG